MLFYFALLLHTCETPCILRSRTGHLVAYEPFLRELDSVFTTREMERDPGSSNGTQIYVLCGSSFSASLRLSSENTAHE
eukprot:6196343-Pleurochrysis_carterae.AAC.1